MASDIITDTLARLRRMALSQHGGLILVVLLLGVVLTLVPPPIKQMVDGQIVNVNNFLRIENLLPSVATPMSWIAIMAVGVTFVIISGGIDISVGSIFALSALGCAAVLQCSTRAEAEAASAWIVIPLALIVPLAIGLGCGLLNGLLIVGLRIHPFIVTLGTMSIFRGIAQVVVPNKTLPAGSDEAMLPLAFTDHFISYKMSWALLQPVPMLVMLVCVAVAWIYLSRTAGGRQIYAVGGNEEAARFSGIPVGRVKLRVYALSGLAAGVAGMVNCGYWGAVSTNTGEGYELTVIAAAVVGGASLDGGRGAALGAMLGALVISLIEDGIAILHEVNFYFFKLTLSKEYSKIVIGIAIIVAVAIDRASEYLQKERLARQGGRRP
jgi:ribose/xylose/arabinose/galactoside ABC-type transport system permease subunit